MPTVEATPFQSDIAQMPTVKATPIQAGAAPSVAPVNVTVQVVAPPVQMVAMPPPAPLVQPMAVDSTGDVRDMLPIHWPWAFAYLPDCMRAHLVTWPLPT